MILETAAQRVEGVADCDMRVLMRMVCTRIAADHDLMARNRQIDADTEELTLVLMAMTAFHGYSA